MLGKRYLYDGKAVVPLQDRQIIARNAFLRKMRDQYRQINVNCLCGNSYYDTLSQKDRYGLPVVTVICRKCGLVYQNPRLDNDSSKEFYSTIYRDLYETSTIPMFFDGQLRSGNRIVNWLRKRMDRFPRTVVEIGCGAGGILKAFQNNGVETLGVDYDERYINYGRHKSLRLLLGGAEAVPKHSADLVILSHVLEHFSDIQKELDTICGLLSANGSLYVELPGVFNLKEYHYDFLKSVQNAHNYYFALGTLEQVLSLYGWKLEYGDENIFSIFRHVGQTSGISKNYYPIVSSRLAHFEKMRWIGQLKAITRVDQFLKLHA